MRIGSADLALARVRGPMVGWHFHNYPDPIDDATRPFPSAALRPTTVLEPSPYFTSTLRRPITPSAHWRAFNPSDNARLQAAKRVRDGQSRGYTCGPEKGLRAVAGGHDRLLFQVAGEDLSELRPIYWDRGPKAPVCEAHWVFSTTMTPVEPEWEERIDRMVAHVQPWHANYSDRLELAKLDSQLFDDVVMRLHFTAQSTEYRFVAICLPCESYEDVQVIVVSEYRANAQQRLIDDLLRRHTPSWATTQICRFQWKEYKRINQLPDKGSDSEGYVPAPVTKLILAVHGIGQKLTDRLDAFNFTYSIDHLWTLMNAALVRPEVTDVMEPGCKFIVLPVNWRRLVEIEGPYNLDDIMMPKMAAIREGVYDVLLDIPLYLSQHRGDILDAAAQEANRLYALVVGQHPTFKSKGQVDIVGHSLGSIIAADLLAEQPASFHDRGHILNFDTNNLYTLGSPLGLFMFLRNQQLSSRELSREASRASPKVPRGHTKITLESLSVRSVYNIAHDLDLIAYRLNPTVPGTGVAFETAYLTPSAPESQSLYARTLRSLRCLAAGALARQAVLPTSVDLSQSDMYDSLNDNGQLDWVIPATTFANQLLGVITAHFSYWTNADFARFLVLESGRVQDREHALPEFRARSKAT